MFVLGLIPHVCVYLYVRACVCVTDIWCNEAKVIYKMPSLDTHARAHGDTRLLPIGSLAHEAVK